jgi:hypothetical protein
VLVGVAAARRPERAGGDHAAERKRLVSRREKLLNELGRLEADRRGGRGPWADDRRYATRREELMTALESVYGALDDDEAGDGQGSRDLGLAAPTGALGVR